MSDTTDNQNRYEENGITLAQAEVRAGMDINLLFSWYASLLKKQAEQRLTEDEKKQLLVLNDIVAKMAKFSRNEQIPFIVEQVRKGGFIIVKNLYGEKIVSGLITPDMYTIDNKELEVKHPTLFKTMLAFKIAQLRTNPSINKEDIKRAGAFGALPLYTDAEINELPQKYWGRGSIMCLYRHDKF